MFVFLSTLLLAVLFVLQPTDNSEMNIFKAEIKQQFAVAASELMGGESVAEPFAVVWSSVAAFYDESTTQAIALLDNETFVQMALALMPSYKEDLRIASTPVVARAILPTEDALLNIIPYSENEIFLDPYFSEDLAYMPEGGRILGESIRVDAETKLEPTRAVPVVWTNLNDSITGEAYCVAIFNGTVNSYPGMCAKDEASAPVYEN